LAQEVERFAPAKVNLALHVLGRHPDGYHELDTLVVFADVGDTVSVRPADAIALSVDGAFAGIAPPGGDNLVLKAAALLRERAGVAAGAEIRLTKRLPAGAGFGGGSADAAAALHALNDLWVLGLGLDALMLIGQALGADVPMCLVSQALRARGRGERIGPVEGWPALPMVLAWPGAPASTASVFATLAGRQNPPLSDLGAPATPAEAAALLAACRNDLEEPAQRLVPAIGTVLETLRATEGCLLARMSGSGSGCFGICADRYATRRAAAALASIQPDWWVKAAEAR
jgi:4-diphosphocytidyl-2-C-methyl-D-erythritol kinase